MNKKRNMPKREEHWKWNGGKTIDKYVRVLNPSHPKADCKGYVYEHILKMEEKLGREIRKGEYIHHKDGNPLNNDINNLEIIENGVVNHAKLHNDIRRKERGRFVKE